jgi:membrane-bound metal-dependent hydrolase YbcI (DUF457 family)
MANYQTHVAVSGLFGAGYGAAAVFWMGFSPVHAGLAGCLTGIAGMLPDLDSESGRPVREVFGLLAAIAPMLLLRRLEDLGGNRDGALLLAVLLYVAIRYAAPLVLNLVAVHRGMFHSIPALVIAAELTFLAYASDSPQTRLLMACGVALGFASHLVLDEIYSVSWDGLLIRLKPSAGSAIKLFGKSWTANAVAWGLCLMLSYGLFVEGQLSRLLPQSARQQGQASRQEAAPLR